MSERDYNPKHLERLVRGFTPDELLAINQIINKRIATEVGDQEENPDPIQPITAYLAPYRQNLGTGTKKFAGLDTGDEFFNTLTGGIEKFMLLAARAGVGKSTLAIQLALGVMATEGKPLLIYSFEMPKDDVLTLMLQNIAGRECDYHLTRNEIKLRGNALDNENRIESMNYAAMALQELAPKIYIVDATMGEPNTARMEREIGEVTEAHGSTPLVIVDSLQDLVHVQNQGTTTAEAEVAQALVEVQQATDCTLLAISQKAKGAHSDDPYSAVLGSVSLIHKPTSVIEMLGVADLMRAVKSLDTTIAYRKLADNSSIPNPVVLRVLKGRFNGHGHLSLQHHGRDGYFTTGQIPDFAANPETSIYTLNGFTN